MTKTSLLSHVNQTIHTENLFNSGDTIVVALSGGADSCALFDILTRLPDFSAHLVVAHINHCLRSHDSDADEEHARSLAALHNVPFESCRVDVAGFAVKMCLNLEDAGRQVRLNYLEEVRIKYKAQAIALAHHADDQAETVLMRLLRGSGMTGLSGMAYKTGYIVRPLLDIYRSEIENYIEIYGLSYREDASNRDTNFLRNRIRHELMPLLKEYNPNIGKQLNVTAEILTEENSLLDNMAAEILAEVGSIKNDRIIISIQSFADQPIALKRRLFRLALEKLTGNLKFISHRHIEALIKLTDSSRPNAIKNLPQGIKAVREYNSIILSCSSSETVVKVEKLVIAGTGSYLLPNGLQLNILLMTDKPDFSVCSNNRAYLDLGKAPFPWEIRSFIPGDHIVPLGMRGTKKVKDIFINKKIPFSQRKQLPLVFCGEKLIWIGGVSNSELAKVDCDTRLIAELVLTDDSIS